MNMISLEILDEPDNDWNKRLLESELGTVHNTKNFVMSINHKIGIPIKPVFLRFLDSKGNIVGQIAISTYSRFYKSGWIKETLSKFPKIKKKIYFWQYGPVIFDQSLAKEIREKLRTFLLSRNCRVSGSEHPLLSNSLTGIGKPFKLNKWNTFLIDLSVKKEILWEKMEKHSMIMFDRLRKATFI